MKKRGYLHLRLLTLMNWGLLQLQCHCIAIPLYKTFYLVFWGYRQCFCQSLLERHVHWGCCKVSTSWTHGCCPKSCQPSTPKEKIAWVTGMTLQKMSSFLQVRVLPLYLHAIARGSLVTRRTIFKSLQLWVLLETIIIANESVVTTYDNSALMATSKDAVIVHS